jgi:biotin carboxyl carrier protein
MIGRELHWRIQENDVVVRVEEANGKGVLHVNDRAVPFSVRERQASGGWIEIDGRNHQFFISRTANNVAVWIDGHTYVLERIEKGRLLEAASTEHGSGEIRALMPGKVLRVDVKVGDTVAEHQTVVIMESMKMETSLTASRAGTVTAVHCKPGQTVDMGEILAVIQS